jgi:hypothetical protein
MSNSQHGDGDGDDTTPLSNNGSNPAKTFGHAALLAGIFALLGSFNSTSVYVAVFLALAGLVIGIVCWIRNDRAKRLAVFGAVLSVVALLLSIQTIAANAGSADGDASRVPLVYTVSAEGGTASITFATFSDGEPSEETIDAAPLPFAQELDVIVDGEDTFNIFTVRASADAGNMLTCTITLDGEVIDEQTSYESCTANYVADN